MAENRQPDIVIDNGVIRGCVYFGERSEEERMRVIKEATADFFQKIRPELIRQGKWDKYTIPASEIKDVSVQNQETRP